MNLAEVLLYVSERRDEKIGVGFDDLPNGWKVFARNRNVFFCEVAVSKEPNVWPPIMMPW